MRQMILGENGTIDTMGLPRRDYKTLQKWKRIDIICPYCLHYGNLAQFSTFKRGKRTKGRLAKTTRCPDCGISMKMKTLIKISKMEMEEYAYWFWENVFIWGAYERVSWEKLKERLKHFKYESRQVFWTVYHEFKEHKHEALRQREQRQQRGDYRHTISLFRERKKEIENRKLNMDNHR